jgi:tetratricopeptide (TPR) repeat protein
VLGESAALDLLTQLAGAARIAAEREQAKILCQWLGYLPLALELVGRYLARKPDLTIAALQQRLEEQELNARALAQTEPGMTNVRGMASAFELSWSELSPSAQELACLLSCFALAPIPWTRVEACFPDVDAEELEDPRDDELLRFSLLKRIDAGRYQLHQLIQRFIRTKLANKPLIVAYGRAMAAAAQEMEQTPTQAQCMAWSEMPPHVAEAGRQWQSHVADDDLIWPFIGLARFYEGQGLYAQAEPWREQCLESARKRFGEEHPDVAYSLNNLAGLYKDQGRYSEAEPLYRQALDIGKRTLGEEHPNVATRLFNLGALRYQQGQFEAAQVLLLDAFAIYEPTLGRDHPNTKSLQSCLDATQAKLDGSNRTSLIAVCQQWLWSIFRRF